MSSAMERLICGFVNNLLEEELKGKTILELGCGFGTWGHFFRGRANRGGIEAYLVG